MAPGHRMNRGILSLPVLLGLDACARSTAPAVSLFGAYFPAWLLCGIIGVLAAAGARVLIVALGAAEVLPAQLTLCVAAGVIVACLVWLLVGY